MFLQLLNGRHFSLSSQQTTDFLVKRWIHGAISLLVNKLLKKQGRSRPSHSPHHVSLWKCCISFAPNVNGCILPEKFHFCLFSSKRKIPPNFGHHQEHLFLIFFKSKMTLEIFQSVLWRVLFKWFLYWAG